LLISYCKTYNINYKIYRLCNVYGDTDKNASAKKNALQFLINKLKNHEEINLYENGDFVRDYMHVDDVCGAIDLCIDNMKSNEIINISNGKPLIFKEIIDYIVCQTQSKSKINAIEIPNFHKIVQVRDMYLDNTKLKNLGFISKVSINDGLNKLI
jgi:dTDP-glucose 4,6-dehydratase